MIGRVLDAHQVNIIEELTHLDIELRPWGIEPLTDDMRIAQNRIDGGEPLPVIPLDDATIAGYTVLSNVLGQPMLLARVTRPRTVFAQAQQSQRALLGLTGLVGAAFVILTMIALQRGLLTRFATFSSALHAISNDRDASLRVRVPGSDELARVADDVNTMLNVLERSEAALRDSEARYALAAAGSNDGIWDWDLRTNDIYYSPRWLEILGLVHGPTAEGAGAWLDRVHPDDRKRVELELEDYISGRAPQFENEHRMRHANGEERWVLVRGIAIRDHGRAVRMAGSLTDITRRGLFDPLTGLPNHALLVERVQHALGTTDHGGKERHALIGIRLSALDALHESMGRDAADELLCSLAARLRASVRASATVARTGSDRFVVLIEDAGSKHELAGLGVRIHRALTEPVLVRGRAVRPSAGLGIVPDLETYASVERPLRDADIAVSQAIELGKPVVFFDQEMFEQVSHARRMELDLRGAAERGELFIQYQPIVELTSGSAVWYEALVRWQHPEFGRISPAVFIPLAEESGTIVEIGRWVLGTACTDLVRARDLGVDTSMSVNLSGEQIFDPGLVDFVQATLDELDIKPSRLNLEVTETALMRDPAMAVDVLARLKSLGVAIVMDDFGTGYSSLSYIHTLPIDKIKIDRSFVADMTENVTSLEIVRTIVGLAATLGLTVVPEGIEREAQASLLMDLGCDVGQGYLYDAPLDFANVIARALASPPPELTPSSSDVEAGASEPVT